jgi:hypothetical protein
MKRITLLALVLLSMVPAVMGSREKAGAIKRTDCVKWIALVDPSLKADSTQPGTEAEILKAIECLLTCKGRKGQAAFGGVTRPDVSQMLPPATVEIAALFYISYLFEGRWDHADGVPLRDEQRINPPGSVRLAYASYARWFNQVRKLGLAEARGRHLSPLQGTRLSWYGN